LECNVAMSNLSRLAPEQLSNINLRTLDCRNNKISAIPDEFYSLVNLWKAHFDNNQISELSPKVAQLTSLKILSMADNELKSVP